ncbi:MAG: alpha/beta hydrolase [Azospirillum brasilense]|nr:MAG: alpha/beta hydrolase [Azospirillum brasilense]
MPSKRVRWVRRGLWLALLLGGFVWVAQGIEQRMVFRPSPGPTQPADAGLPHYQRHETTAADGATIMYWSNLQRPAGPCRGPVVLYFHGNGGGLHGHTALLDGLDARQLCVVAMEYRGYPGAPSHASERAIVGDAVALYDDVARRYPQRPIIFWGYSLGSGVAVQAAVQRPPAALVLEAPFTSVVARAKELFPFAPTFLMRNRFDSLGSIAQLQAPLLILHGTDDGIIPLAMGEQLYAAANPPKQMQRYASAHHTDLWQTRAYDDAAAFIHKFAE